MQSESVIILMLSYQLYCFFTCQMLDVKADGQHTRQTAFNLFLQGFVLIRIVAVAEHSGHFQLLMLVLDDADSTESNHATEEGGNIQGWSPLDLWSLARQEQDSRLTLCSHAQARSSSPCSSCAPSCTCSASPKGSCES